jgi:hypothetical protein
LRRQAIVRTAKRNINNHFILNKKMNEEKNENDKLGQYDTDKNLFREQHHHLLSCLEHATVCKNIFKLLLFIIQYNL